MCAQYHLYEFQTTKNCTYADAYAFYAAMNVYFRVLAWQWLPPKVNPCCRKLKWNSNLAWGCGDPTTYVNWTRSYSSTHSTIHTISTLSYFLFFTEGPTLSCLLPVLVENFIIYSLYFFAKYWRKLFNNFEKCCSCIGFITENTRMTNNIEIQHRSCTLENKQVCSCRTVSLNLADEVLEGILESSTDWTRIGVCNMFDMDIRNPQFTELSQVIQRTLF